MGLLKVLHILIVIEWEASGTFSSEIEKVPIKEKGMKNERKSERKQERKSSKQKERNNEEKIK